MTIYNVFLYRDLHAVQIEAPGKAEALAKGLAQADAEGTPVVGRGYYGAEVAGSDGPGWMAGKPAVRLEKPYACKAAKSRYTR